MKQRWQRRSTPEHPRWGEFMERLYQAFHVNVHCDMGLNWHNARTTSFSLVPYSPRWGWNVEATCHFFGVRGFRCDCAVLFGRSSRAGGIYRR